MCIAPGKWRSPGYWSCQEAFRGKCRSGKSGYVLKQECCCGKRWRRDFIHHGRQRCCRCSKRSVLALNKYRRWCEACFFKYLRFILFLPAVLVIYYLTPAKVKIWYCFWQASFLFVGSQNTVSCCSFFCCSRLYGWKMHREYQRQKSVSVLLIQQTDPENKGGHDRLVVGVLRQWHWDCLVFLNIWIFQKIGLSVHMFRWCDRTSGRHQFYVSDHQLLCGCFTGERLRQNTILLIYGICDDVSTVDRRTVRFQSVELKHREDHMGKTGKVRQGSSVASVKGFDKQIPYRLSRHCKIYQKQQQKRNQPWQQESVRKARSAHWVTGCLPRVYVTALWFLRLQWYGDRTRKNIRFYVPREFRYPFISKVSRSSGADGTWRWADGSWLLYNPLGGNRVSVLRWCFNMLLSGCSVVCGTVQDEFCAVGIVFGVFLSARNDRKNGKKDL